MPFKSKKQWRAAMAGYIPGIGKNDAHEWAHETPSFKKLPNRAPAEKGKPTLRAKRSALAVMGDELAKSAGSLTQAPGKVFAAGSNLVKRFSGAATANSLKPAVTASAVIRPGASLSRSMKPAV